MTKAEYWNDAPRESPGQRVKQLEADNDRGFSMLEHYGIPRARAKSVANGIQVFDSRMQKEIRFLEFRITRLEEESARLYEEINVMDNRIDGLEAKNATLGATQRKIQELCESNKGLQRSRTGWTSAVLRIIAQHTRQSKPQKVEEEMDGKTERLEKAYEEAASNGCSQCDWKGKLFIKTENGDVVDDVPCPFCRPTNRGNK